MIEPTDKLHQLFERQKEFRLKIGMPENYILHSEKYQDVLAHLFLAADELKEARGEIPFRFGKVLKNNLIGDVDTYNFTREMADTFIFMINAMLILGIDAESFINIALVKQQRNFQRIENKERFVQSNKAPIILIDGPDGVGKSEICKILSQKYQIPVIRMVDADREYIEQNSFIYNTTIDQIPGPLILDRGFSTSIVYSDFFGRAIDLTYLTRLYSDRDVMVFIIVADQPFRDDEVIDSKMWTHLRDSYITMAKRNQWEVIKNDTTIDNCVAQIIRKLQF